MDLNIDRNQIKQEIDEQGLVQSGVYEGIITDAGEDATPSGAEFFGFKFVIRNDLDNVPELANTNGKFHNRKVFFRQFKSKESGQYSNKALERIGYAAGASGHITSLDQFINAIENRPIRAYIKLEDITKQDGSKMKVNNISPFSMNVTSFQDLNHKWKDVQPSTSNNQQPHYDNPAAENLYNGNGNQNNGDDITVSNDDLPF